MRDPLEAMGTPGQKPLLIQFWRSSASWRVRWALALKRVPFETDLLDLMAHEQDRPEHRARSPLGTIPALVVGGRTLTESVAIVEWLEELFPEPPLFPKDPWEKARVRQVVELVNSGTQPFQSEAVRRQVSADPERQKEWTRHFNARGLAAVEELVRLVDRERGAPGRFAVGDALTAADLFVVPQLFFARRFHVDLSPFPRLLAAEAAALATPGAEAVRPETQPGAPELTLA